MKVFLDTNILVFLVDNTFQALNDFVEIINESKFVELVSSQYAIFEFIGVRKREHYLRIAAKRSPQAAGGDINFSSLLKFKDDYSSPGTVFEDVAPDIKTAVIAEVIKIFDYYKIDFDYSSFHNGQLEPTRDLCLASKLGNQDCLILVSSVLPERDKTFTNVLLLTDDTRFVEFAELTELDTVLLPYSIPRPRLLRLNNIQHDANPVMNLKTKIDIHSLKNMTRQYLLQLIQDRASSFYLGKTIAITGKKVPNNCVAFRLVGRESLPASAYITILSKDLDFIYTTKTIVPNFLHNGTAVTAALRVSQDDNNISFLVTEVDEAGAEKQVQQEILDALRKAGHFVFIHPDSA